MPRTSFQRLAIAATAITYLLIAVGGLVRASGAGLGCPDWPRCFGSWIPPASAAELPPQFDPTQFNPTLMWTEYLNRLLGVTVGFAILAATVSAWRHHRRQPRILWPVVAAVLLTGFQGWLGGRVVAHELAAWIVTVHMVVALVIVSLLLVAVLESMTNQRPGEALPGRRAVARWTCFVIAVSLFQVGLGTQVRGRVDAALDVVPRAEALATVGALDLTHRELAAVTGLAVIGLWLLVWTRYPGDGALVRAASLALAAMAAQVVAGVALTSAALPPPAQVLHLTFASLMLGALTATAFIAWRWSPVERDRHARRPALRRVPHLHVRLRGHAWSHHCGRRAQRAGRRATGRSPGRPGRRGGQRHPCERRRTGRSGAADGVAGVAPGDSSGRRRLPRLPRPSRSLGVARAGRGATGDALGGAARVDHHSFVEGLSVNLLGPIILTFYLVVVPTFIRPSWPRGRTPCWRRVTWPWRSPVTPAWVLGLDRLRHVLQRRGPRRLLGLATSVALLLLALRVLTR